MCFNPLTSTWTMCADAFIALASFFDLLLLRKRFLVYFKFLSITPDQSTEIFAKVAKLENACAKPKHRPSLSPRQKFSVRPTVLLRLITPSGFSITVRAILDSGAWKSVVFTDLSTLLAKNGANYKHVWPYGNFMPFWEQKTLIYREMSGLKFQSVENESLSFTTSIAVDESFAYMTEDLPVDLVLEKMAFFELPMVQSSSELGRTMWSREVPNSQYRADMLIGQDLLNAHFNMTPLQPTYHITPSLAIIRTKMGLAFIGHFDTEKFKKWSLSATEAQKMKETLYPESDSNEFELSPIQREELNNILTYKVSEIKQSWKEFIHFFCNWFISIHVLCFVVLFCFVGLLFKYLLIITCAHRVTAISSLYFTYLYYLFSLSSFPIEMFINSTSGLFCRWLNSSSIGLDQMFFSIKPLLPLTVKSKIGTKTVMALIDTGASSSHIYAELAGELNLSPSRVEIHPNNEKYEWVKIEVGRLNGDQLTQVEVEMTSTRGSPGVHR